MSTTKNNETPRRSRKVNYSYRKLVIARRCMIIAIMIAVIIATVVCVKVFGAESAPAVETTTTYTTEFISSGDTLLSISEELYTNDSNYSLVYNTHKDLANDIARMSQLMNPHHIETGNYLMIPVIHIKEETVN